ncbi:hypothetical protein KP509_04G013600 [Ceratopteris richardii]|uniref:Uncharacterized protein n=1 Tax=Ceratopteris richardii TaxID=49495 RepID=A0A8T2UXF4_CERRI|nr:hypothetical protein KP509_04G013600 [Ceratopteris richardii]KAH7438404.1 hypothetical protein KP509_04G013600 [Ceratopteris richardii]
MGSVQSVSFGEDDEGEEEEELEEKELIPQALQDNTNNKHLLVMESKEKLKMGALDELEQDPEIVPFESSASPASSVTTPHLGPSVKVWDPGHMLSPLSLPHHGRNFNMRMNTPPGAVVGDEICTDIYLIRHAESNMNTLPGLISGRSPSAMITPEGKRQARALGVFLLSHGVHFDAVFSSPLERCKQTAIVVCQEVNFSKENIEYADALMELSQGLWEGLRRSEIYSPELLNIITSSQPDFRPPGGESQRQVEFRMMEFMNNAVLPKAVEANVLKDKSSFRKQGKANLLMQVHPLNDTSDEVKVSDGMLPSVAGNGSLYHKGSGKSRLHIASSDAGTEDDMHLHEELDRKAALRPTVFTVAIFSHATAIKCLLRGILGSDPRMTHRFSIENTSTTVLRHSTHSGWEIQRINDTAHLRLL